MSFRDHEAFMLCSEVLHDDLTHRSVLMGMRDKVSISSREWLALASLDHLLCAEIAKRVERLGGLGGEW